MLRHIAIQNYALIDQLDAAWSDAFTVITGETGSGKSILLGALSLILGKRADTSVLRNSGQKCVVEAQFDLSAFALQSFFEENDLDYEPLTTLRREINKSGKSRAFINDTPVRLSQMQELGDQLVDIHSQHETLNLRSHQFQLAVLDDFAGSREQLEEYRNVFKSWRSVEERIESLEAEIRQEEQVRDFKAFQLDELNEAALQENEQEEIEQELQLLNNAEEIKGAVVQATEALQWADPNATGLLEQCQQLLDAVRDKSAELGDLYDRLKSSAIELKDIARELEMQGEGLAFNPTRASELQERLDLIYRLQQKHGVNSIHELQTLAEKLQQELSGHESREQDHQVLVKKRDALYAQLLEKSEALAALRRAHASSLQERVNALLNQLEMKSARLQVSIEALEQPTLDGTDRVTFMLKANKGHNFQPIQQAASGGELSRVMLALKSLHSGKNGVPTLILDEIDSGVSGKVANAMAELLNEMGRHRQLICITHLPQIAARGQAHYRVSKSEEAERTITSMEQLDREGRIYEIAGMLSGFDTTDAAIENARSLMHLN